MRTHYFVELLIAAARNCIGNVCLLFVEIEVYVLVLFAVVSVCLCGLNYGLLFRMGDVAVLIRVP
jgi:hypothetical protein